MNWPDLITKLFSSVTVVVMGVEALAKEAPSTTKLQMAQDALGLSTAVAENVLPAGDAVIADGVSKGVSDAISGAVAAFHAAGIFTAKIPAPTATK